MGNNDNSSTKEELRSLLDPLAKSQLVNLLSRLGSQYPSIAEEIKRKSRGYGFITYRRKESMHSALRVPTKLIDGVVKLGEEALKSWNISL
ncbi:hypothetical protein V6N12_065346 [Hibiscus sabdariffa]|uniref:RRM domain-containing protein n=1 Tax=Hibiscus sabdariffa TaxID=183260 RepID=A0ABR2G8G5_9ROSI